MTTLTIEIPDNEKSSLLTIIKSKGGSVLYMDSDEDLSAAEFELMQTAYRDALLTEKGINKALPFSELWND